MFSFGVSNLRRLMDVPSIAIKPITLLVGRNSSGKSSYLRALPLLRQSAFTRTSSPILWYGDFVDFGSYEGAVSNNDIERKISFRFSVDNVRGEVRQYFLQSQHFFHARPGPGASVDCEMVLRSQRETAQICAVKIRHHPDNRTYDLSIDEGGEVSAFTMNDEDLLRYFPGAQFFVPPGSILPALFTDSKSAEVRSGIPYTAEVSAASRYLTKAVKEFLDKRLKDDAIAALCADVLLLGQFTKETLNEVAGKTSTKSWAKLLRDIAGKDTKKLYKTLEKVHHATQAIPIFRGTGDRLKEIISEILYIGPARARSERYYRYQDLSVSEIDPDGKNFAMFLNSLKDSQLQSLSKWIESLFGYRLELSRNQGHISINVVVGSSITNVIDTGYGVSQVLPVLGQIWWAANKPGDSRIRSSDSGITLLAVEQPELHLHPAHQALLADALVGHTNIAPNRRRRGKTHFLIETHSETLVNRLGQLIAEKKILADDVQIILFEPSEEDERRTEVRIANFGEEGQLIDWPYGFFQPEV